MPNNMKKVPMSNLSIKRIYLKDLSFEVPSSPAIFQKDWIPDVDLDIYTRSQRLAEGAYEVVIGLSVTVSNNGGATVFLCELQQAGIFDVRHIPKDRLARCLGVVCPNILFPYARETISSLVGKGTFPQINLAPINFEALLVNPLQEKATQGNQDERR